MSLAFGPRPAGRVLLVPRRGVSPSALVVTVRAARIAPTSHGLLAAVGMPPGDLGRMVLVEAGLLGVTGTICGFIGGLIGLATFSLASTSLTGLTIPFRVSFGPLFLYGIIGTVCVLAGAALPAWRTSRLDPVVALRYE